LGGKAWMVTMGMNKSPLLVIALCRDIRVYVGAGKAIPAAMLPTVHRNLRLVPSLKEIMNVIRVLCQEYRPATRPASAASAFIYRVVTTILPI
jgi:hypothetical protein